MNIQGPFSTPNARDALAADPWITGIRLLRGQLKAHRWFVLGAVAAGATLGMLAAHFIPPNYIAKAQIYIDPGDNRTYSGDTSLAGQMDANSQINLVQSEIGVILSEPVLLRALRDENAREQHESEAARAAGSQEGNKSGTPAPAAKEESKPPVSEAARTIAELRAAARLQRAVSVTRSERSFLVDVAVKDHDPEKAARLANGIVQAYMELQDEARDRSNERLASALGDRIRDLRPIVAAADEKIETYRAEHHLTGQTEKELSDQLTSLEERHQTALANVAQLSATLGDRHPDLIAARDQLTSIEAQIKAKQTEIEDQRRAEVELNLLQSDADANRKIFNDFQRRYREANEYGRMKASNIRVISVARAPATVSATRSLILYSIFGGIFVGLLVLSGFILRTLFLPLTQPEQRYETH